MQPGAVVQHSGCVKDRRALEAVLEPVKFTRFALKELTVQVLAGGVVEHTSHPQPVQKGKAPRVTAAEFAAAPPPFTWLRAF